MVRLRPQAALRGLQSRMIGSDIAHDLELFSCSLSEAATSAYISDDNVEKEFIIKVLYNWAKCAAYKDTIRQPEHASREEWKTVRGTDTAPLKDYYTVLEHCIPMAFAYFTTLADFQTLRLRDEHAVIRAWLMDWYDWLWPSQRRADAIIYSSFGFNWQLWGMTVHDLVVGDDAAFMSRLQNIDQKMISIVNDDGSITNCTIRGSRATWYHFYALNELFFAAELLLANGMDRYERHHDKLSKAVDIWLNTIDDMAAGRNNKESPAYIYAWARQDYRSADEPTTQDFAWDVLFSAANWLYIYLVRYPYDENAARIRRFLRSIDQCYVGDGLTGLNLGCLYRLMDTEFAVYEYSRPNRKTSMARRFMRAWLDGGGMQEMEIMASIADAGISENHAASDINKHEAQEVPVR